MKDKKIDFVGLGRIGGNMARCLVGKGYTVSVLYNISPNITKELAEEIGTSAFATLPEITAHKDIVFTVVADDAAMESIFFGEENLLDEAAGTLFMNCATLTPSIHVKVDSGANLAGAHCLKACRL